MRNWFESERRRLRRLIVDVFLIVFERFFAISSIMIFLFAVSTFDLIAIRRFVEWLKVEIFSILISISFFKSFSITIIASTIILNRFLWCVYNVNAIAYIKLIAMCFEIIINHFFLNFFDVLRDEFDFVDQARNLF